LKYATCTRTGRVVYDRKTHPFSWRDVRRIANQLEAPDPFDDRFFIDFWSLFVTQTILARKQAEVQISWAARAVEELGDAATKAAVAAIAGPTAAMFFEYFESAADLIEWQSKIETFLFPRSRTTGPNSGADPERGFQTTRKQPIGRGGLF
jgi:hypothetical protein